MEAPGARLFRQVWGALSLYDSGFGFVSCDVKSTGGGVSLARLILKEEHGGRIFNLEIFFLDAAHFPFPTE